MRKRIKFLSVLFAAIIMATSIYISAGAEYIDLKNSVKITVDGYGNEDCWFNGTGFSKTVIKSENVFATVKLIFANNKMYGLANVSEDCLIPANGELFDGIKVSISGSAMNYSFSVGFDGSLLSGSDILEIKTAASTLSDGVSYTVEFETALGNVVAYGDSFTVSVDVKNISYISGENLYSNGIGSVVFNFVYGQADVNSETPEPKPPVENTDSVSDKSVEKKNASDAAEGNTSVGKSQKANGAVVKTASDQEKQNETYEEETIALTGAEAIAGKGSESGGDDAVKYIIIGIGVVLIILAAAILLKPQKDNSKKINKNEKRLEDKKDEPEWYENIKDSDDFDDGEFF